MGALKPSGDKANGMSREKKQAKTKKMFDSHLELVSMFLIFQNFNYSLNSSSLLGNSKLFCIFSQCIFITSYLIQICRRMTFRMNSRVVFCEHPLHTLPCIWG